METLEVINHILQTAKERDDDWGRQVIGRLQGVYDLVAEEASYHKACMSAFRSNRHSQLGEGGGRIQDSEKQNSFNLFCEWFETELEDQVFTFDELYTRMLDEFSEGDEYSRKYFQRLLLEKYDDDLYITNEIGKIGVLCLKDKMKEILRDHTKALEQEEEDTAIIKTAALLIRNKIRTLKIKEGYPSREEMVNNYPLVPEYLRLFLSFFVKGDVQDIWAQNFIKSVRPRSGVLPCQLGLAVQLDHQFGSKWLIDRLHRMKVCESYAELQTYKWSIIRGIVLKELLDKPPTLKPVASTVETSQHHS